MGGASTTSVERHTNSGNNWIKRSLKSNWNCRGTGNVTSRRRSTQQHDSVRIVIFPFSIYNVHKRHTHASPPSHFVASSNVVSTCNPIFMPCHAMPNLQLFHFHVKVAFYARLRQSRHKRIVVAASTFYPQSAYLLHQLMQHHHNLQYSYLIPYREE